MHNKIQYGLYVDLPRAIALALRIATSDIKWMPVRSESEAVGVGDDKDIIVSAVKDGEYDSNQQHFLWSLCFWAAKTNVMHSRNL